MYRDVVKRKVQEIRAIGRERTGVDIDPIVTFEVRGTCAGKAFYLQNRVDFNETLLNREGERFVERTVVHEMAHLLAHKMAGFRRIAPHGTEWKRAMRILGAEDTARCHNYNLDGIKGTYAPRTKYVYACPCGVQVRMGDVRHRRTMLGQKVYVHACGNRLPPSLYTGKTV